MLLLPLRLPVAGVSSRYDGMDVWMLVVEEPILLADLLQFVNFEFSIAWNESVFPKYSCYNISGWMLVL